MLALAVFAFAPKWIDASIAGYAFAYDEVHKPVGVRDERTGYMLVRSVECDGANMLIDPFDVAALAGAMRRTWREPALREELVGRGEARASQFSWRRAAEETLDVYRRAA